MTASGPARHNARILEARTKGARFIDTADYSNDLFQTCHKKTLTFRSTDLRRPPTERRGLTTLRRVQEFFEHVDPTMRKMAELMHARTAPANITGKLTLNGSRLVEW
jgi:hypothetical protein